MNKNQDQPLFSIITVCLNEPKFEHTCASIVNQTFQHFEWIVIDGGSGAETLAISEKYNHRMNYFVSEKDNGVYDAMNKGIAQARGTWINFMNAGDTFAYEYILEYARKILSKYSNIDVFYGEVFKKTESMRVVTCTPDDKLHQHFITNTIPHQSAFIKRSCFEKYGDYDTNLKIAADYKFFMQLYNSNARFLRWNCIVATMDGNGLSSQAELNKEERMSILKQFYTMEEIESALGPQSYAKSLAKQLRENMLKGRVRAI